MLQDNGGNALDSKRPDKTAANALKMNAFLPSFVTLIVTGCAAL